MAVQLTRSLQVAYKPVARANSGYSAPTLKVVSNPQNLTAKIMLNASMEKAQLNQRFWDELLEKLKKGGGGGGGSSFDRVKVSMQLMDFISNKMIQSLLKNINSSDIKTPNIDKSEQLITNQTLNLFNTVSNIVFKVVLTITGINLSSLKTNNNARIITDRISNILISFSFQLNKLKEEIFEKIKDVFKKLKIKERLKKAQAIVFDIFVQLEETLIKKVNLLRKSLEEFIFKSSAKIVT